MAEDLGEQLVRAGLASEEALARALSNLDAPLVMALVQEGVSEAALVEYFEGLGFVRLAPVPTIEPEVFRELVPAELATRILAVPVDVDEDGSLRVVLANPLDERAVAALEKAAALPIRATVATLTAVADALSACYPDHPLPWVVPKFDEKGPDSVVLPLVRPKSSSPPGTEPQEAIPLTRRQPTPNKGFPRLSTQSYAPGDAPRGDRGVRDEARPARKEAKAAPTPAVKPAPASPSSSPSSSSSSSSSSGRSFDEPFEDSWDSVLAQPEPGAVRQLCGVARMRDIGDVLAGMRGSTRRDAIIRHACQGAATVAHQVSFMVVKGNLIRGFDAVGGKVSRDVVRHLWISLESPSHFRDVVDARMPYVGPVGASMVDQGYHNAVGRPGGPIVIEPILLMGRVVGLLIACHVEHGQAGVERVAVIAHHLSEALTRIVSQRGRSR